MAISAPISQGRNFPLFLNISFLSLLSIFLVLYISPSNSHLLNLSNKSVKSSLGFLDISNNNITCKDIHKYHDNGAKCQYVKFNKACKSDGYINYLHLFYCTLLMIWLIILFYILGNTATNYFCSSLENLSRALKLSPTIAGVTLLSIGSGSNDVFSSLVSFMGDGTSGVGLNSVLGGVFFISCIVVGVISLTIGRNQVSLDKSSFIRDVVFLILSLCALLVILIIGKINIWGAICFISLYLVYVGVVSTTHLCRENREACLALPLSKEFVEKGKLVTPLLGFVGDEKPVSIVEDVDGYEDQSRTSRSTLYITKLLYILELPLYLPRRLTIPVVSEENWSRPYAVVSVTLAPVLLAVLWNVRRGNMNTKTGLVINSISGIIGLVFGSIAFACTERCKPPKRYLLPWLVGGFLMSITWNYLIAEELVSLLVSLGNLFGISASILGLTVLAWGNSLGDLISNVALSTKGGADGVQIAITGCYAEPFFNTVVGLGLPLIFSCWSEYPSPFIIPNDPSLYETLGFLIGGLLWALVILSKNDMKLDRVLGFGLVAIYLCFLSVRMVQTLGIV
ncbi:hypothetical protein ACHQM5_006630 [Ranunculus cassubicifolius]